MIGGLLGLILFIFIVAALVQSVAVGGIGFFILLIVLIVALAGRI